MKSIVIAIPALNEIQNLMIILPEIVKQKMFMLDYKISVFVIVGVDSSDFDNARITNLGAKVIMRQPTNSFGDAIRSGITASLLTNPNFIIVMDADGSHNPETLPKLVETIEKTKAHVVVASRYIQGGGTANTRILQLMSKLLNKIYSSILNIPAKDVSNNYKIYQADSLKGLNLTCTNFDIVEEILLEIKRKHGEIFKIKEIPDDFLSRISGKSNRNLFTFILSYGITLFRLRFREQRR